MSKKSDSKKSKQNTDSTQIGTGNVLVQSSQQDIPEGKMHVKIYAPFKVYYDGLATSITALNDTGPFDILQGHHNFMTLLSPCDIIVRGATETSEDITVTINRGIMHVKKDEIAVFLDV